MKKYKDLLFIAVIFLPFIYMSQIQDGTKIDESAHHLPTILTLNSENLFVLLGSDKYLAANTPLPYILSIIPYKIFGTEPEIKGLRLFNSAIAFFTLVVLYLILRLGNSNNVFLNIGIILFYPYYLKPAFSYYMALYGVLFFLISYLLIQYKECKIMWGISGFFLALAILSQQFYIAVIPAFIIYIILNPNVTFKKRIINILFFLVPIFILCLPVFIIWNGITHISYSFHETNFDITNLTSILLASGGLLFFYFISSIKEIKKSQFKFFVLFSALIAYFFYPNFSEKGGYGNITGYSFHFVHIIENINYFISFLLKLILVSIGLYSIFELIKGMKIKGEFLAILIILFFLIGFLFSTYLVERHMLPLFILLIILSSKLIKSIVFLRIWFVFHMALGTIYYIYYMFYQPVY